jgi:hypothetical protein
MIPETEAHGETKFWVKEKTRVEKSLDDDDDDDDLYSFSAVSKNNNIQSL